MGGGSMTCQNIIIFCQFENDFIMIIQLGQKTFFNAFFKNFFGYVSDLSCHCNLISCKNEKKLCIQTVSFNCSILLYWTAFLAGLNFQLNLNPHQFCINSLFLKKLQNFAWFEQNCVAGFLKESSANFKIIQ